jgi:hypothetical protein
MTSNLFRQLTDKGGANRVPQLMDCIAWLLPSINDRLGFLTSIACPTDSAARHRTPACRDWSEIVALLALPETRDHADTIGAGAARRAPRAIIRYVSVSRIRLQPYSRERRTEISVSPSYTNPL